MALYKHRPENDQTPLFGPSNAELDSYQNNVEDLLVEWADHGREGGSEKPLLADLLDITPTVNEGISAIVDDSFTRCFRSNPPEPWNWNLYLFPLWCCGVIVRYLILFPIRLTLLILGWIIFFVLFMPLHFLLAGRQETMKKKLERWLVEFMCSIFVASWTGVIKYHGPRPSPGPNKVWVANHTSMIDFIVLEQMTPFSVIMQKHPGWVGFVQRHILESVGCVGFSRTESKDRQMVAQRLREHVRDPDTNPLLIFPEGTCVNNEYCVMFKKGAFELGATVCPIAIKYNKIFVDAFWNSKKQSFSQHLVRLMTAWAVVCDVYYLEPQAQRAGESTIEFAERVQAIIADRINIKVVPWDGYLKYYRPSIKLTEKRQAKYSEAMIRRLEAPPRGKKGKVGRSPPSSGKAGGDGVPALQLNGAGAGVHSKHVETGSSVELPSQAGLSQRKGQQAAERV